MSALDHQELKITKPVGRSSQIAAIGDTGFEFSGALHRAWAAGIHNVAVDDEKGWLSPAIATFLRQPDALAQSCADLSIGTPVQ
ncbi:hypothetical protein CHH28_07185 [Bacterioplanes sanyensis]|uniref:Uncharacterized protein n=1 Tax=Bacterioplanes sanyensis TaxID=1249553 RepID=A0A222FHK3_9GAMM|nr:hypothetical protein CHH28_07185 [Bacterioplanes sanyensis]